jgi:hypothetical protein
LNGEYELAVSPEQMSPTYGFPSSTIIVSPSYLLRVKHPKLRRGQVIGVRISRVGEPIVAPTKEFFLSRWLRIVTATVDKQADR